MHRIWSLLVPTMILLFASNLDSYAQDQIEFTEDDEKLFEEEPSPFQTMPDSYFELLNGYSQTEEFFRCREAVQSINSAFSQLALDSHAPLLIWSSAHDGGSINSEYLKYLNACYNQFEDIKLPEYVADELLAYVRQSGVFVKYFKYFDAVLPFCAGIRIDSTSVLTAKHCLYDAEARKIWEINRWSSDQSIPDSEIGVTLSVDPSVSFLMYGNMGAPLNVDFTDGLPEKEKLFFPKSDTQRSTDRIVLKIANSDRQESPVKQLSITQPLQWDKLWMISLLPNSDNHTLLQETISRQETSPVEVFNTSRIVLDDRPTCYIWAIKGTCIFHSCQSIAGLSGSPLISLSRQEGVQIVGVHTGANSNPEAKFCNFTRAKWIKNYGVSPP